MLTDPIADMLTRLRNGIMVHQETVVVPASQMKLAIARILKDEGFITDYELVRVKSHREIKIRLRYSERGEPFIHGLKRVSKPGLRVYAGKGEMPRVYGGVGIALVSTPRGVMTGRSARREGVGGELLGYIW